jgi:ubiquinone/menaquinone biosynthesis C-methylase UbiE
MASSWLDFWNGSHRIYVNARHAQIHYAKIAADFIALIPSPDATVVDWGCGEASEALTVAAHCRRLVLCDAASATRGRLIDRFAASTSPDAGRIVVCSPEDLRTHYVGQIDLFVVNSVLQYLSPAELDQLLADARMLLAPGGSFVVADVIPTHDDLVGDVRNLLATAWANGFFLAALRGLAATFFSRYRTLRNTVGLTRYDEAEFLARLRAAGFKAERLYPNMGFDTRRMAFRARLD